VAVTRFSARLWAVIAAGVALVAGPSAAGAQGRPGAPAGSLPGRVHVKLYPDQGLTEAARLDLEARLAAGVQAAGVAHVGRAAPESVDARAVAQALARNDSAAQEARRRTTELDLEGALNVLDWAAEEYGTYLPELVARDGKPDRLVEIHVLQAIAHYLNGDESAATAALQRAMVLDPALEFDPAVFPPQLEAFVERQVRIARATGRTSLRVTATPGRPVVFVNGVERGTAPLLVRDVPVGPNMLHVRLPGAAPAVRPVVVRGRLTEVEVALELLPDANTGADADAWSRARGDVGAERVSPALREAAAEVEAEGLLLVLARPIERGVELTAYAYDMRSGELVGRSDTTVPHGTGGTPGRERAAQELGKTAMLGAAWRPLIQVAPGAAPRPIWRRTYFWAAVGAAAGAVAIGVVVASSGLSNGQKITLLPVIQF
jgi:hypothetical protein